jgi:hypothetical protein
MNARTVIDRPVNPAARLTCRWVTSWWARQLWAIAAVALLGALALALRAEYPAHKVWWPAGAAVALVALWGPRLAAGAAIGSAAAALWWTGEVVGSLLFGIEQAAIVVAARALLSWPWRIQIGLDKLSHMGAFIAFGAGAYALLAALAMAVAPDTVRHVRGDLAAAQQHTAHGPAHPSAAAHPHMPGRPRCR